MANDYSARQPRRKYCQFCKENTEYIDYKEIQLLRKYMTDRGKIKPCPTPFPWFLPAASATAARYPEPLGFNDDQRERRTPAPNRAGRA